MMDLSFIIPAYNEDENIENTLDSIRKYVPGVYQYEVVVVDHDSTDNTVKLAVDRGAKVLVQPGGTIAGLRNFGVASSQGDILIFLDADILLTHDWGSNIGKVISSLTAGERLLTGSWISIPDNSNWIEKFWFKPLERGDNSHINSGHLIISRKLFDEIGGFDDKLETGEDYDISIRAKNANIKIVDDVRLKAVHEGYPKSLVEFAKREFWHGKGDATSFRALFQSKVALVALLFVALHVALIISDIFGNWVSVYCLSAGIIGIVAGMACLKYRTEALGTIIVNSFIYYVYFWARGLSALSLPGIRNLRKRIR